MSDERSSSVPVGDRTRVCPWTPLLQQPKIVPGSGEATEYADGQAQCSERIGNDSVQGVRLGI